MKKDQMKRNLPAHVVADLNAITSRYHPFLTREDAEVLAIIAGCGALKVPAIMAEALAVFKRKGANPSTQEKATPKATKKARKVKANKPYTPKGTIVKSIITAFRDNPGASVGEIASIVYGPSDPLRLPKVRGFITTLRNRGVLQNFGVGRWRLTEKDLTAERDAMVEAIMPTQPSEPPEADVKAQFPLYP